MLCTATGTTIGLLFALLTATIGTVVLGAEVLVLALVLVLVVMLVLVVLLIWVLGLGWGGTLAIVIIVFVAEIVGLDVEVSGVDVDSTAVFCSGNVAFECVCNEDILVAGEHVKEAGFVVPGGFVVTGVVGAGLDKEGVVGADLDKEGVVGAGVHVVVLTVAIGFAAT